MESNSLNLQQKLVQIRMQVKGYLKDVNPTAGVKYKSVSGAQIIGMIRAKMDELNILLVPNILSCTDTSFVQTTKYGERTMYIIKGQMEYQWINGDNPNEVLNVKWFMSAAQDDIAKAIGSALTYAERYFLMKFFQAPTDDLDPDRFNHQAVNFDTVTEDNIIAIKNLARAKNVNDENLFAYINSNYKVNDITKLNITQYENLMAALSTIQVNPNPTK